MEKMPRADNVSFAAELWQEFELDKVDEIVKQAFSIWPSHKDLGQVKAKIGVLNALWEAGVLDVGGWAEHICRKAEEPSFESRVMQGDRTLVLEVAEYRTSRKGHTRHNRVAASKYLHFSNPQGFPIWDSMAVYAVKYLNGTQRAYSIRGHLGITNRSFADYTGWCEAVGLLCNECGCQGNYKVLDQYLWLLGYAVLIQKGTSSDHWLVGKLVDKDWRRLLP